MLIMVILLYGLSCGVCGFMGRKTTFGFIGHFLLAIFITPLLSFIIQAITRPGVHFNIQTRD
ncbi:hypothetical protein GE253_18010 [Niveispirillum sp. SYP-B3756]|uniref:hypothetical protein n=1 Tax=Niveispirillum sp. SYP-B3756 TaxID=2662178 RepID=UPI0012910B3E|nr:hypothetical protein [Niveispirillum sp. SYP-B3756]MQP67223.1 hypothetical protein [Niveispirillum sp. SYP-B3756]